MERIGSELKAAREKQEIPLTRIAEETRISLTHLENIEKDCFSKLPGGMYNRAFLRAYCDCLGLDSKRFVERYEEAFGCRTEKPARFKAKARGPSVLERRPSPIVLWSIMFLLSVGALFLSRKWISEVFSPYFSGPSPMPLPAESRVPAAQAGAPELESPPPQPSSGAGKDRTAEAPQPEPHASLASPPPGAIRLEFQVLEKCWVSVDSDGSRVLVKVLDPGDDQSFEAAEHFYIVLGNAGGVRAKINGKPAKPLGSPGEVVRVRINHRNLHGFLQEKTAS